MPPASSGSASSEFHNATSVESSSLNPISDNVEEDRYAMQDSQIYLVYQRSFEARHPGHMILVMFKNLRVAICTL